MRFDANDVFCLDRQFLKYVRDVPGEDPETGKSGGLEFRTEIDSFSRVLAYGCNDRKCAPGGTYSGPTSWVVLTKDGRKLEYGDQDDARVSTATGVARIWALNHVQDRAGNDMSITYRQQFASGTRQARNCSGDTCTVQHVDMMGPSGELVPSMISYGGLHSSTPGSSKDPSRFVEFLAEPRPQPQISWHFGGGAPAFISDRIYQINTYVGSQLIKRYKLQYDDNAIRHDSRLKSVQECALEDGAEICKAPGTAFQYHERSDGLPATTLRLFDFKPRSEAVPYGRRIIRLDADGDGRDELLVHGYGADAFEWALVKWNPADGTSTSPPTSGISNARECISNNSVIDLNRDGKDDLLYLCPGKKQLMGPSASVSVTENAVAYISGQTSNVTSFSNVDLGFSFQGRALLADYDGDGFRDLITCEDLATGNTNYLPLKVHRNRGAAAPADKPYLAFDPQESTFRNCVGTCKDLFALDIDNDGAEELIIPDYKGNMVRCDGLNTPIGPAVSNYKVADLNGDGLKDILAAEGGASGPTFLLNIGGEFTATPLALPSSYVEGYQTFISELPSALVAFGADGKARDSLVTRSSAFALAALGGSLELVGAVPHNSLDAAVVADLAGDGSADIANIAYDDARHIWLVYSVQANRQRALDGLLKQVVDGYGKQIDVEYNQPTGSGQPASATPIYSSANCKSDSATTCLRKVTPLVRAHHESQVSGTQIRKEADYVYSYADAKSGLDGRGWFGFGSRTVEHVGVSKTTLTYQNGSLLFAGRLSSSSSVTLQQTPANVFTVAVPYHWDYSGYQWETHDGATDSTGKVLGQFPYLRIESHLAFDSTQYAPTPYVPVVGTITTRSVDQFGTVDTEKVDHLRGADIVGSIETTRTIVNDPSSWLLGLVTDTTTKSTRGSESSRPRHIKYGYTDHGLLQSIEREPESIAPQNPDDAGPQSAADSSLYQKTIVTRDPVFDTVTSTCVSDSRAEAAQRCTEVLEFDPWRITPRRVRDPEGVETSVTYSVGNGQLLVAVDANGQVNEAALDAFERVQQTVTPTARDTYSYELALPEVTAFSSFQRWSAYSRRVTHAGSGGSTEFFDAFGRRVATVTSGIGQDVWTEAEYDSVGLLRRMTLPHVVDDTSQGLVTYQYDGHRRLIAEQRPDGTSVEYFYPNWLTALRESPAAVWFEGVDRVQAKVVQQGRLNIEAIISDPWGKALQSIQATSSKLDGFVDTRYTYGPFEVLRSVQAPGGTTTIDPDDLGRTKSTTDPNTGTETLLYNGFDEVVRRTDANDQITVPRYDRLGRISELRDDSNALIAKWLYDGQGPNERGRLVGHWRQTKHGSDVGNWVRYHYQAKTDSDGVNRGLVESISYGLGGTPDDPATGEQFSIGYKYRTDIPWWVDTLDYPGAEGVSFGLKYEYSLLTGAVTGVSPADNPTKPYWRMLEADQAQRLKSEQFGNGVVSTRSYVDVHSTRCAQRPEGSCMPGLLDSIVTTLPGQESKPPVQSARYGWDRNGNLRFQDQDVPYAEQTTFALDDYDRLTDTLHANDPSRNTSTTYDRAGNIMSRTGIGPYTYSDADHTSRVMAAGGVTYGYDAHGNMKSRSGLSVPGAAQQFEYNDFHMPWRVTSGSADTGTTTLLEYDAAGNRLIKRRYSGANLVEVTRSLGGIYDRIDQGASAGGATGSTVHRYKVFAGARQVAEVRKSPSGGAVDTKVFYLHDDPAGTVSAITTTGSAEGTAAIVEQREFSPHGEELPGWAWATTGVLSGFTGHEHDVNLGLVNMKGRLYDPHLARFTTPDPFIPDPLNPQAWNRYSYVNNNPTTLVDPSGFDDARSDKAVDLLWVEYVYVTATDDSRARAQAQAMSQAMLSGPGYGWGGPTTDSSWLISTPDATSGFRGGVPQGGYTPHVPWVYYDLMEGGPLHPSGYVLSESQKEWNGAWHYMPVVGDLYHLTRPGASGWERTLAAINLAMCAIPAGRLLGGAARAVPGLSVTNDGMAIWAKVAGDPKAFARIVQEPGALHVTDIFRGAQGPGSGSQIPSR